MKIYYACDPKGKHLSSATGKRYQVYTGKAAYNYLHNGAGKGKYFLRVSECEDADEIWLEVSKEEYAEGRKDRDRKCYVEECRVAANISWVPLDKEVSSQTDGNSVAIRDAIAAENSDSEHILIQNAHVELLEKAINDLNDDERELILDLYLRERTLTEENLAAKIGVSQQAISKKRQQALKKLKKLFEAWL